jgi:uncharacterized protein YabE (DUF348 family)
LFEGSARKLNIKFSNSRKDIFRTSNTGVENLLDFPILFTERERQRETEKVDQNPKRGFLFYFIKVLAVEMNSGTERERERESKQTCQQFTESRRYNKLKFRNKSEVRS